MITDGKKWHYLALKSVHKTNGYNRPVRSLSRLLTGITAIITEIFIVWAVYIHFEQIAHLINMKGYVVIMIIAMLKCLLKIITH